MKALVYTANHETTYRDEPDPSAGEGEALVRIDAVGICGSDMHAWHGHDPRRVPPLILGHEAAGTVLSGALQGRRVVLNPLISCGRCDYCTSGRSNLCLSRDLIGMVRPGAFAERIAIPERNLIEMPEDMDPARAALTEPCATAWHAVALAGRALCRPIAEAEALVIGGGSVGLLGALILEHFGCARVCLAETNPLRRGTVERCGIETLDPMSAPIEERSFDLVVDAVGSQRTRAAAIAAVKPGGVISHLGLQEWAGDFDARTLTLSEVTFIGVYTYTEADLRASLTALHAGALGNLDLLEERSLADGAQAFHDLDRGQTPAAKIVLRP